MAEPVTCKDCRWVARDNIGGVVISCPLHAQAAEWKALAEKLFEEHEHDDMAEERRCRICKMAREMGLKERK